MSATATVDPLNAVRLGFPKLRYVFVELERRWVCTSLPRDLVRETVRISDLYVGGSNLRLREERFTKPHQCAQARLGEGGAGVDVPNFCGTALAMRGAT